MIKPLPGSGNHLEDQRDFELEQEQKERRSTMGECAEDMIDGFACECCGQFFADGEKPGYPRRCTMCGGEHEAL